MGNQDLIDIESLSAAARLARKTLGQNSQALALARATTRGSAFQALKAIEENSSIHRMLESVEKHRATMRAVEGPLAELRRSGIFDTSSPFQRELQLTQQRMAEFTKRFRLPDHDAITKLAAQFRNSPLAEVHARYSEQSSALQNAMESMRTPWLDKHNALQSVGSFAELQGIGGMLAHLPTFDEKVAEILRRDLGDWRDSISWPTTIFTDLTARSKFYIGLGFEPELTDFPAPAFQAVVTIAGLRREPPLLVDAYGLPVPRSEGAGEEEALTRTNDAHDWLLQLETQVRKFIDDQMTLAFGVGWPKHRLPNGLCDKWQDKKGKAEAAGARVWPLIAYADFTDYELIICKTDNWREVFGHFFGRPESVRETFQRLYPIRLDTMHARPITQDDELLLYVETRRLIRLIFVQVGGHDG